MIYSALSGLADIPFTSFENTVNIGTSAAIHGGIHVVKLLLYSQSLRDHILVDALFQKCEMVADFCSSRSGHKVLLHWLRIQISVSWILGGTQLDSIGAGICILKGDVQIMFKTAKDSISINGIRNGGKPGEVISGESLPQFLPSPGALDPCYDFCWQGWRLSQPLSGPNSSGIREGL